MTILTVQLIVEFSKRLPGFDKLEREDQITLLKVTNLTHVVFLFLCIFALSPPFVFNYTTAPLLHVVNQDNVTTDQFEDASEAKFRHITEMTILTVQLTVEFSKRLPGFDTLLREDQITLLKVLTD